MAAGSGILYDKPPDEPPGTANPPPHTPTPPATTSANSSGSGSAVFTDGAPAEIRLAPLAVLESGV